MSWSRLGPPEQRWDPPRASGQGPGLLPGFLPAFLPVRPCRPRPFPHRRRPPQACGPCGDFSGWSQDCFCRMTVCAHMCHASFISEKCSITYLEQCGKSGKDSAGLVQAARTQVRDIDTWKERPRLPPTFSFPLPLGVSVSLWCHVRGGGGLRPIHVSGPHAVPPKRLRSPIP